MTYPLIFGISCVGLVTITIAWLALIIKHKHSTFPQVLGPVGTLIASIPILGAWMPDVFQPLWIVVQLTCMVWLTSFVLIGLAVIFAFTLNAPKRVWITAIICGGTGFMLNAIALLAFMWYATTSPGGV